MGLSSTTGHSPSRPRAARWTPLPQAQGRLGCSPLDPSPPMQLTRRAPCACPRASTGHAEALDPSRQANPMPPHRSSQRTQATLSAAAALQLRSRRSPSLGILLSRALLIAPMTSMLSTLRTLAPGPPILTSLRSAFLSWQTPTLIRMPIRAYSASSPWCLQATAAPPRSRVWSSSSLLSASCGPSSGTSLRPMRCSWLLSASAC
mmetsp:Transcript_38370/g.108459  ORF Transcript_38370/g.108459 Transcript_38370/m.108459 type:complete len:205 (-) Transcript_38370:2148-2762(-)